MADKATEMATRDRQHGSRAEQLAANPFSMLERFADEIDSVFDGFGLGRRWLEPRSGRRWQNPLFSGRTGRWAPDIEVSQKDSELVVCADLPGMKKDDVSVEITDSDITISGERRHEVESELGGTYRTERSYGSFCRTIPLPEGAMADKANATFKNGVLEIRMPAPDRTT